MLESTFCRKFMLSHHFSENNPKYIIQNWRKFLFPRDPSTKTYLTFCTIISEWEIHAHLYSLFFRLCKILFYTYFCRAYCDQLEQNFRELREVYMKKIFIYNNLFHFLHIYFGLRHTKVSLDPNFAEFLEQNSQRKEIVSDLDASLSTKSWIKFKFSSFPSPIHKK